MFQRMDWFFILGMFLLLCTRLVSLISAEKIAKKYWLNKRDIKEFGRKIKGINIAQDEFDRGVMSHLPEVKRYLQREFLENAVRIRENSNQNYTSQKIQLGTNADDQQLTFHTPWAKVQNNAGFSYERAKYGHSLPKHRSDEDVKKTYFKEQEPKQRYDNEKQISKFNTFEKEPIYSKEIKNSENGRKRIKKTDYYTENTRNNKYRKIKRMTERTKNSESNDFQDTMKDFRVRYDNEIPTNNVHSNESVMNSVSVKNVLSLYDYRFCDDDDYDDDNDRDVDDSYTVNGNDSDNDNDSRSDNVTKYKNDCDNECDDQCDNDGDMEVYEVHSPSERIPKPNCNRTKMKQNYNVVLKTDIGMCSIWIVGMFLTVIVLTCGCFFISILCLEHT